jgi:hypothetical protein
MKCPSMLQHNEPWKDCAKWKKLATREYTLCDFTCVKCPDLINWQW